MGAKSRVATASVISLLVFCAGAFAQEATDDIPGKKAPSVTMAPAQLTDIVKGKESSLTLHFKVGDGFHINSNTPTEEYLIPTALKLDVPTDIVVRRIGYPTGEAMSFSFAPDEKLSVYSGSFDITVGLHLLSTVLPGKYEFRGQLKYQACDNASCYPPKQLPVAFEVRVLKSPPAAKKNPGQSPHVHS